MESMKSFMLNLHPVTATMNDNTENFGEYSSSISLWNIIQYIIFFSAIYLSFKCKGPNGSVRWGQLLLAMIFSPFYVIYRLARPCV